MNRHSEAKTFLAVLFSSLDHQVLSSENRNQRPPPALIKQYLSSPGIKQIFLTLHCIFPDHLLPALDLLEREKVSQFVIPSGNVTADTDSGSETQSQEPVQNISESGSCYYVEASSNRSNRFSQMQATRTFYEVRLQAWNCSCPAFTFAALEGELDDIHVSPDTSSTERIASVCDGGLAYGDRSMPMCKHLLSCLLANASSFLKLCVKKSESTEHEIAAWAAGWVT